MRSFIKILLMTLFISGIIYGINYFRFIEKFDLTYYDYEEAYTIAAHLSSQELQGRAVGETGNKLTIDYIDNFLEENEIEYEKSQLKEIVPIINPNNICIIDGEEFELYKDFEIYLNNRYSDIDFEGDILYLGEALNNVDPVILKDKIVVIRTNRVSEIVLDTLIENEVKGVFYFTDIAGLITYSDREVMDRKWLDIEDKISSEIFVARITSKFAEKLLEKAKEDQFEEYYKKMPSVAVYSNGDQYVGLIHNAKIFIDIDYKIMDVPSYIIHIDGKDSTISNNFITHFDGQGKGNDTLEFFPSAVNGGASTGALLEMAKSLNLQTNKPKEDINIVLINGFLINERSTNDVLGVLADKYSANKNIVLEYIGYEGSKGVAVDWDFYNNQSVIMANLLFDYSSEIGVKFEFHDEPIARYASYAQFTSLNNPLVLITGTYRNAMSDLLYSSRDSADKISVESMSNGINLLRGYISKDLYRNFPFKFLDDNVVNIISAVLILGLLISSINEMAVNTKIYLIEKIFYSRIYTITVFIYKYFISFATALLLIAIVLNIPTNYNMVSFGEGTLSNFSLYNLIKGTYYSILSLISTLKNPSNEIFQKIIIYIIKSLKLIFSGLLLALIFGILKGVMDSYSKKSNSSLKTMTSIIAYSIPDVMVAILSVLAIIYLSKIEFINEWIGPTLLRTLVMPIVALVIIPSIYISRLIFVTIQEEKQKEYVKFLYYKGIPRRQVYFRQFVFVSVIKVLKSMKSILMVLFSNLILVEYIFSYPGIMFNIIMYKNNPYVVIIFALVIGFLFILITGISKLILRLIVPKKEAMS
ncbi:MAG: ABC transporter permease subunit [Clostridiales bacterium]|nr:ABC transporter permease subunit [Clostridiales bacterium]